MKAFVCTLLFLFAHPVGASDFLNKLKNLENHDSAIEWEHRVQELKQKAESQRSWDEPMLKGAAKNFPIQSFSFNDTPMTGIELSVSQKIPLTNYKSLNSRATLTQSSVASWEKEDTIRKLRLSAWKLVISWLQQEKEAKVLQESLDWLDKKIEVTQSLYVNGKVSQQALLELQIRRSQITTQVAQRGFEQRKLEEQLSYIFDQPFKLKKDAIPLRFITTNNTSQSQRPHAKEAALKAKTKLKTVALQAQELQKTPDITVGAGYTLRSGLDGQGDFLSVFVQVPLPLTPRRKDQVKAAKSSESAARLAYRDYRKRREMKISKAKLEVGRIKAEKKIINSESITFSESSRDIISKSYGIGNASYVELLAAEISLQKLRLQEVKLWASLLQVQAELKYLKGERLW